MVRELSFQNCASAPTCHLRNVWVRNLNLEKHRGRSQKGQRCQWNAPRCIITKRFSLCLKGYFVLYQKVKENRIIGLMVIYLD